MKNSLLVGFVLLLLNFGYCQQPSLNFETWNPPPFGFPHPQGWTSANVLGSALNDTVCHKAFFPNVNSGSFSMKLETIKLGFNLGTSAGVPDTVCFALTGNIVASPALSIKPGFAFTGRPSVMSFYYKYLPSGTDSASAGVYLTKWVGNSRDTVAVGIRTMGGASNFIHDSIALIYRPSYVVSGNPDTAVIFFASSNIKSIGMLPGGVLSVKYSAPKIGSLLWVDDIGISPLSLDEINKNAPKFIFPNPSDEEISLQFSEIGDRSVQIINSNGVLMNLLQTTGKELIISTSNYPVGLYYYQVSGGAGMLYSGKFAVSR